MAEIVTLTDSTLEATLNNGRPVLIVFSAGDGLRGDFVTAYRKAADANTAITFAQIDPTANPVAKDRFQVGSKPVLVGVVNGDEVTRRNRPWGTDVGVAVEAVNAAHAAASVADVTPAQPTLEKADGATQAPDATKSKESIVDTQPIDVTDATFQQEVIDHDLPVVVDFWAEWCGPCRMVAPILDKLAGEYAGKVRIAKVDVDQNPGLSQTFQIRSIPTLMMIKDRTIVFSQPGALPEPALRDLFDQLVALEIPPREDAEETEPETEA